MNKTMAEVLIDHQRQNSSSCLCGWSKLGHSHPEHQAAALSAAGFGLLSAAKANVLDEVTASDGHKLAAAILNRRLRKCIAEGAHPVPAPDTPERITCPRCGQ